MRGMLDIRGFQETSFLDWDGKVCSVVYVPNCNFRCPFCHNAGLIENPGQFEQIPAEKIVSYLKSHKDFVDGVCITGGEPSLHKNKGLLEFIRKVRGVSCEVKVDTNGADPDFIGELLSQKLVDYFATDIKSPLDKRYNKAAGVKVDLDKIKKSIDLIMKSGVLYEFRTTVVPTLHSETDIEDIAKYIKGAQKFVLQQFVPKETLDKSFEKIKAYQKEELEKTAEISRQYVPNTVLRGI